MANSSPTEWQDINVMVDDLNTPDRRTYSDTELGAMFRSYVAESQHSGWDGFSDRDQIGIRRMLFDMTIYAKNMQK